MSSNINYIGFAYLDPDIFSPILLGKMFKYRCSKSSQQHEIMSTMDQDGVHEWYRFTLKAKAYKGYPVKPEKFSRFSSVGFHVVFFNNGILLSKHDIFFFFLVRDLHC